MLDVMLEPEAIAPETIRGLSRAEYDVLVERGTFDDERVELLYGTLVRMSPQGIDHAGAVEWFVRELIIALGRDYRVRGHSPFAASDDSEPEPDVVVAQVSGEHAHPSAALLLIEVSESSLRKDRGVKAAIYAANGAPEYWIVDLQRAIVLVHTQPVAGRYTRIETLDVTATLRPIAVPEVAIRVADIPWPIGGARDDV
jgi:Uma2 family endonuclease